MCVQEKAACRPSGLFHDLANEEQEAHGALGWCSGSQVPRPPHLLPVNSLTSSPAKSTVLTQQLMVEPTLLCQEEGELLMS